MLFWFNAMVPGIANTPNLPTNAKESGNDYSMNLGSYPLLEEAPNHTQALFYMMICAPQSLIKKYVKLIKSKILRAFRLRAKFFELLIDTDYRSPVAG